MPGILDYSYFLPKGAAGALALDAGSSGYVGTMVRPRIGYAMMGAGIAVSLVGAVMLVDKHLVGTAVAFGVAVLLVYGGALVAATAGTAEERKRRQAQAERWAAAMGEAWGKASGGWTLRRREHEPRRRNSPD